MFPACMRGFPVEAPGTYVGTRPVVGLMKGLTGLMKGQMGTVIKSCSTQVAYIPSTLT